MDSRAILPLTFYCRNAQLCLAKATESQKSGFVTEELQHLKSFTTLVSETIPLHPNFRNRQEDKQVLELHAYLPGAAKRIRELETSVARLGCVRPSRGKHPKPPLASSPSVLASRTSTKTREGGSLDQGQGTTTETPPHEEWNDISEDTSRDAFRTGYGDESSGDSTLKHGHHRRKKASEQRGTTRGSCLREWKGDFVRKAERVYGQGSRRPVSAPRRMQGVLVERKVKDPSENVDEVKVSGDNSGAREKPAVLASRLLQRGMKEECEHFRRDMRILLAKANDSRNREAEVEGMLRSRCLVDEMDLAAGDAESRLNKPDRQHHPAIMKSPRMNRLRGGHPLAANNPETSEKQDESHNNINNNKPGGASRPSRKSPSASNATASGSSSGSSMTSLPLSHYIQKLKKFSPDSQLGLANLELLNKGTTGSDGFQNGSSDHHDKYHNACDETGALPSSGEIGHHGLGLLPTTLSGGSAASAIFLPASTNSSNSPHGALPRSSPRLVDNRFGGSAHSALYSSLAHPPPLLGVSRLRPSQQLDGSSLAMFNSNPEQLHDEDQQSSMVTSLNDQLLYPHFQNDTENDTSSEAKDEKLNSIQRVLGELKGSVKGMKIRLEVDGQGWRGRVEGLEKELENLKEEADDEIIAAKHSLRNEMKVKLGDLMAEMERIRRQERDEVEVMVKERIEKQLKAQKETRSSVDMKDEIHRLWSEVDALVKNRQEMQGHVAHLTSVAQKAQEHANREHEMLKSENGYLRKQLQSLKNEGVQVRLETENFRVEREDLRLAVEKVRAEGTDTKLEIQSLKKMEKLIKAELENIRTGFVKFQEETQDLQRQNAALQVEGGRECKMIMERVESLSQRYLGGLEEIRGDVFNVKFNCRDRIQEFENHWNEFRTQHPEKSNFASKQMLLEELDHFRGEIAEMVEIERGLVQQTLERESERVQREVKDLLAGSKGEIVTVVKLDVQKWLQTTHEGVFLMAESLKQDLNHLKAELGRTQEGAEDLIQIASAAELQRNVAAAAAADASKSASKASNVLVDVTTNINNEMKNTHHRIKQFQEDLIAEQDSVASAMYEARKMSQELQREKEATFVMAQEARQKHQELQDYLGRESSRLSTALMVAQKERDAASQAASEATSSALKAREALSDILCAYDSEMAKARHVSSQLQEGIANEKAALERERELALKHCNHNAKDRFSEELELAIDGWKRAMNTEIFQAKEEADEMQKQLWRHAPFDPGNPNLQVASVRFADQPDLKNYILKTEESISGLAAMVKELQDYKEYFSEEKKRRMILKQQENERKEQHWNGEISQINQVVRVVEKRVLDVCGDYNEVRKRLKKCEGSHMDLVHTVEEVSSSTNELAKTVTSWLPRYEAAARVVNDLSCKVELVEEKFEGFSCDEGLVQRISRIAETKVEGLKELVSSSAAMEDTGQELRDLHERVESSDRVHCQAVGEVASRVAQLERTVACGPGQPCPGLSLKVEYTDSADARKQGMGSLSQSVEALKRKMEYMTEHTGALVGDHESATDSRLHGLERRFEHVASATFTNLRLLDSKVDRVALGMQSAVEGAALAESKCGALGAELVKVFRMLTASNHSGVSRQQQPSGQQQRSRSPPAPSLNLDPDDNSCSQSPRNRTFPRNNNNNNGRALFSPKRRARIYISPRPKPPPGSKLRGLRTATQNGDADCMRTSSTTYSGSGKLTARDQESTHSGAGSEDDDDDDGSVVPNKQSCYYLRPSGNNPIVDSGVDCKVHAQRDAQGTQQQTVPGRHGRPSSAIRLEAGRLHVNVSHRSDKRENMIAVQS